ncbi:MAG: hypothetical protein ACO1Q7_13235 [Gemmatimonas sp.]
MPLFDDTEKMITCKLVSDGTGVVDTFCALGTLVLRHLGVRGTLYPRLMDVAV